MPYQSTGRTLKFSWNIEISWTVEVHRKDAEVCVRLDGQSFFQKVVKRGFLSREEAQQYAHEFCQLLVNSTKQHILSKCKELQDEE